MIDTNEFLNTLNEYGFDFFTGVPDSLLKNLCAGISNSVKLSNITAANEGNAVSLACGYYLSSGKPAVVYMQNSGIGNAVNPLLSLADEDVYSIPFLMIVGWRGEPGTSDEPQHKKQGKLTIPLFETIGIQTLIPENDYRKWKSKGLLFQCNYISLIGGYGQTARQKLEWMLKENMIDLVASDVHKKFVFDHVIQKSPKHAAALRQLVDVAHNPAII